MINVHRHRTLLACKDVLLILLTDGREVNEPELVLTNILKSINIQELKERLKTHQVVNVTSTLRPSPATTTEETVNATHDGELRILFANLHAMELAEQLLQSYKMTIERGGYSPYSG